MRFERIFIYVLALTAAVGCRGREADPPKNGKPAPERPKTAEGPGLLWKVSSPTNTVYVVGSIHLGKKEYYPLPAEVEDAFAECKTLVVELDATRPDVKVAGAQLLLAHGTYPKGQSLSQSLSKPTRDLLEAHLAGKGLELGAFNHFRPWTVALLLSVQEMMALGWSDEFGIDEHFCAKARTANKPIIELETAEEQVRLFSSLAPELQEQMLAKTVTELHHVKDVMDLSWSVWYAGDHQRMDEELLRRSIREHPEFAPLMKKLIDDRNVEMVKRIETFLNDGEPYFVLVGAGHLVGDKGIVRLLETKGYKVEQIRRTVQKKAA